MVITLSLGLYYCYGNIAKKSLDVIYNMILMLDERAVNLFSDQLEK